MMRSSLSPAFDSLITSSTLIGFDCEVVGGRYTVFGYVVCAVATTDNPLKIRHEHRKSRASADDRGRRVVPGREVASFIIEWMIRPASSFCQRCLFGANNPAARRQGEHFLPCLTIGAPESCHVWPLPTVPTQAANPRVLRHLWSAKTSASRNGCVATFLGCWLVT